MAYILFVEDDKKNRETHAELFRLEGHIVKEAPNLESALEEAKYLTEGSVVITDKNLGSHRGIFPLLNYLEENKPDVKVILYSGEVNEFARRELYCHAFFQKGDDIEELLNMISQLSA